MLLLIASALTGADDFSPGVEVQRDLAYKEVAGQILHLDLYRAAVELGNPLPVVVFFHGGGFRRGRKEDFARIDFFRETFKNLIADGKLAAASVNYRLTDESTPLSLIISDCKDAINWLRENAGDLGLDPSRIGLMGHSTGGYLSLMAGLDETPEQILFIIGLSAPTDFLRHWKDVNSAAKRSQESRIRGTKAEVGDKVKLKKRERKLLNNLFGGIAADFPDNYAAVSPVNFIKKSSPPILLLAGTRDEKFFPHAGWMRESAEYAGANLRLIKVENAKHRIYRGAENMSPTLEELQEEIRNFVLSIFRVCCLME